MNQLIPDQWKRIAGLHSEANGDVGVVWLGHDQTGNVLHCYDAAIFRQEILVVMSEGISARGRMIPVAWSKKDKPFADQLEDAGLNMLPDPCQDSQAFAEVVSREIWQKMRTNQFRVEARVGEWIKEYQSFYRDESKVPTEGFPLMAATRHAVEMLEWAEGPNLMVKTKNYPEIRIR